MGVDPVAEIESAVRALLPTAVAPWHVVAERRGDGAWTVELTHEASNGLVIDTVDLDEADAIASVTDTLATNHELERIARAPKLDHPGTIAGVRTLVQAFGWSRTEVRAVVGLLREVEALNDNEADWLNTSFGEDRPAPRPTGIV